MRVWLVWPDADFPRTPTGKPRLAVITAAAAQILDGTRDADAGRNTQASNDLVQLLHKFSSPSASPGESATRTGESPQLEAHLNLGSLDRVELMSALEERYQVELSETAFAEARTVADVQQLLRAPAARRTDYAYPLWTLREPVRWLRLTVYYALAWPATQILADPKILGRENLGNLRGPALIVSNHITRRADSGLIQAALPARYRNKLATAVGGETLRQMRRPPRDWFFAKRWAYQLGYWMITALFTVFPLPQFSGFRESFRFAGQAMDRGYNVLVFPEGHGNDTETGDMDKFQSGIGLLAENLNVPIIPMRLDGVWKMRRERRRFAKPGEVTIHIGAPVTFPADTPPDEIAARLREIVSAL